MEKLPESSTLAGSAALRARAHRHIPSLIQRPQQPDPTATKRNKPQHVNLLYSSRVSTSIKIKKNTENKKLKNTRKQHEPSGLSPC